MKTKWFIAAFVFIALAGGLTRHQSGPRVIGEAEVAPGEACIVVREIQLRPVSLKGLLRVNPLVYRLEYYRRENEPMLSAQTFFQESNFIQSVQIKWQSPNVAMVVFDETVSFKCVGGWWIKNHAPTNSEP